MTMGLANQNKFKTHNIISWFGVTGERGGGVQMHVWPVKRDLKG